MEVTFNLCRAQFLTLKDFDMDMFKNGTKIINEWGAIASYVADNASEIVVQAETNSNLNFTVLEKSQLKRYNFKMLPLFFVEDKPVYPGDVLYDTENEEHWHFTPGDEYPESYAEYLTWNKPKVKKEAWVNLYKTSMSCAGVDVGSVYSNEDKAKNGAVDKKSYIKTIRIEWEE